ncbi:MAG: alpha/beta fold hydrolase [Desulfovibrionaceae bacterium]|nr:alpha/beta fold hydrolase [Desulfovibrionaceae bacterium]
MRPLEAYLGLGPETVYLAHNAPRPDRPTVLLVHGLGDSHLAWTEALGPPLGQAANVLALDLAGYGRSSAAQDYSFAAQAERLRKVLEFAEKDLGAPLDRLCLAAHSMGAAPAVLLCAGHQDLVKGLVLVEGSISPHGSFVSAKAREAHGRGEFEAWFEKDFVEDAILNQYLKTFPCCGHYFASLMFCRRPAFLANALELGGLGQREGDQWRHEIGEAYAGLTMPRLYCHGNLSTPEPAKRFLRDRGLAAKALQTDCHFVMKHRPREFYRLLRDFVCQ